MLRQLGSICAALVVAAAVSSAPAEARGDSHHGGGHYGGAYYGDYWGYYAAAEPYYDDTGAVSYCTQRFRIYDPSSGTYVEYDGYRHPCP